tara:strand:+ start:178 stop:582 length:405 start_codon:yes stop_codon:yes gene_type:complete
LVAEAAVALEDRTIKVVKEPSVAVVAVVAKDTLAVLVDLRVMPIMAKAQALLEIKAKLEKVAAVEIMVEKLTVVLEEKVVVKERMQILALEEIMVLVLLVDRVLRFVKQAEYLGLLEVTAVQLLATPIKQVLTK